MINQLVVFRLANEYYGISIAAVESVIKLQPITFVPHAPMFVEGVTNLRGKILPVIDLRKRLGLTLQAETKHTRIMVTELNKTMVGMIVDSVHQVLHIAEEAIEPPSPIVTTVDSAFISGIARSDKRLIIVLDLEKILRPEEKNGSIGDCLAGRAGNSSAVSCAQEMNFPATVPDYMADYGVGYGRRAQLRTRCR